MNGTRTGVTLQSALPMKFAHLIDIFDRQKYMAATTRILKRAGVDVRGEQLRNLRQAHRLDDHRTSPKSSASALAKPT